MANLGVSIDEVWQQASLVSAPPSGPKRSKYTVPFDPTQQQQPPQQYQQQQQQQIQEYYGNNNRSAQQQQYDPEYQQRARTEYMESIPISRAPPPVNSREMQYVQAPPNNVSAPPVSSEIPYLKEQLTQQSNTVMDCQKEMYYMKAIINQLKKELHESRAKAATSSMSKEERRKQWGYILWMLLVTLLLVIILVILVQLSNQFKKLINTSLMA